MKKSINILQALLLGCAAVCSAMNIESANENVTLTFVEEQSTMKYYAANMDENNHAFDPGSMTPLFRISDVTVSEDSDFYILEDTFTKSIAKEGDDYVLYSKQSFDYEDPSQRKYALTFIDQSTNYIHVTFTINNIDDEPPTLTAPQCNLDENTVYTTDTSPCSCTVGDPDGWLASMTFNIIGDEAKTFAMDYREVPADDVYSAEVYIYTTVELKYPVSTFHSFDINAFDSQHHNTTPNSLVKALIYVNDLRDTPPVWTSSISYEQFEEKHDQTFTVQARDGDTGLNEDVFYKKVWEDEEDENYIIIDETSGEITVRGIDRDKNDISFYNFQLLAYVDENYSTPLNVSFYIIDIDDNPPRIKYILLNDTDQKEFDDEDEDKGFEISFLENFAGSFNTSIFIQDIDTGENAQFNVDLEMYEGSDIDYTKAFIIVPTSGYRNASFEISVRTASYLDYEDENWRNFQFYVVSTGKLDPTKTDRLLVSGSLIDYNDEFPLFNDTEFDIDILETAEKGTLITQITATDRDAEDQGKLNYRLEGSSYAKRVLRIQSPEGQIYVDDDDAFDYDKVNPIFVQVVVNDLVNHTTSVTLTINLIDVNNKAPTISIDDMVSVEENQVTGITLNVTITATDPDTDANLTAGIDWENTVARKNSRPLNMSNENIRQQVEFLDLIFTKEENSTTINIELEVNANNPTNTTPDFELFDALYLSIIVTDLNTDPAFMDKQNSTSVVMISIIDINDNIPYFPEADLDEADRQNRSVQDAAKEGISVGSITAIDLDVGDIITYYCDPFDPDFDWLLLDNSTGAFTVRDNGLVDADTGPTYYFYYNCTAVDTNPEHISDVLNVPFYVIDVNNKEPVITINDTVYVVEKSDPGELVAEIETFDADRDLPFRTVLCSFRSQLDLCAQVFKIENNTIKVLTGGNDLDRDRGPTNYSCAITCIDNPNQEQGDLTQHVKSETFIIKLIDINDNTPELNTGDVEIYENIKKEEEVAEILATDIDEGMNAEVVFKLNQVLSDEGEDVTNLFAIVTDLDDYVVNATQKRSHLVAQEDLKGHFGNYIVFVTLTDRGEPSLSGDYTFTLVVNKFNFEEPRFVVPNNGTLYTLLSKQDPDTQLVQFRESNKLQDFSASDDSKSDSCVKWNIGFDVEQITPDGTQIFSAGKTDTACTFQLHVNDLFDETTALKNKVYELMLIATVKEGTEMDGEAPYTSNINITIVFQNETQEPIFDEKTWTFSFVEEVPDLFETMPYKAYYQFDDDDQFGPFYFINADNYTEQFFAVDLDNGTVSLIERLDYETDEEFAFEIVASNSPTGFSQNRDPNSAIQVTVTVIDINDNPPMWTSESFYGAIMPTYTKDYPVVVVNATDADKIDQGKLKYNISSDFERYGDGISAQAIPDPFTIEETTGQIYLNFAVDSTMNGYFVFDVDVNDPPDDYNGTTHRNVTSVTIFIVTSDNVVEFKFQNTRDEVTEQEEEMLDIVSDMVAYEGFRKDLDYKVEETGSYTYANLFFVNTSDTKVLGKETILKIVSSITIFLEMKNTLYNQTGLTLVSFPSSNSNPENLEAVLRAWLIGVSVVLGTLCFVLLITYILKMRQLNQRIKKLVDKTFGSQESGLNRLGVSLPTANKHTIEGSNPIFTIDKLEKEKDLYDYQHEHDRESIKSGDSDLIGVEENPEFDYNFNQDDKKVSTYM